MAKVKLFGGVTYNAFGVDEGSHSDDLKETLTQAYGNYSWNSNTKLLANFNDTLSGSNFDGSYENIDHFQVYKTLGEQDTLHKVCQTENPTQRLIEDFAVGDLCDYQYYIFGICNNTMDVNGVQVNIKTISPLVSDKIQLHRGTVSVIGLVPTEEDNIYTIDEDNIWQLDINLTNDGYTLNTDKTFYQTQNAYGKATGGNRKQRTMSITGLLGKIDCSGDSQYIDTYDDIINWENFVSSNSLKMLIDLRGLITIGDTDANPTFQYDTNDNHDVSVTFTFNQLNDIDTVDVLGMIVPINPLYYEYLSDSEGALLKDTIEVDADNKYHEYLASPLLDGGLI